MVKLKLTFFPDDGIRINVDAFDGKLIASHIGDGKATFEFESLTHIGSNAIDASLKKSGCSIIRNPHRG